MPFVAKASLDFSACGKGPHHIPDIVSKASNTPGQGGATVKGTPVSGRTTRERVSGDAGLAQRRATKRGGDGGPAPLDATCTLVDSAAQRQSLCARHGGRLAARNKLAHEPRALACLPSLCLPHNNKKKKSKGPVSVLRNPATRAPRILHTARTARKGHSQRSSPTRIVTGPAGAGRMVVDSATAIFFLRSNR